jgi:hypothetical protein
MWRESLGTAALQADNGYPGLDRGPGGRQGIEDCKFRIANLCSVSGLKSFFKFNPQSGIRNPKSKLPSSTKLFGVP